MNILFRIRKDIETGERGSPDSLGKEVMKVILPRSVGSASTKNLCLRQKKKDPPELIISRNDGGPVPVAAWEERRAPIAAFSGEK